MPHATAKVGWGLDVRVSIWQGLKGNKTFVRLTLDRFLTYGCTDSTAATTIPVVLGQKITGAKIAMRIWAVRD